MVTDCSWGSPAQPAPQSLYSELVRGMPTICEHVGGSTWVGGRGGSGSHSKPDFPDLTVDQAIHQPVSPDDIQPLPEVAPPSGGVGTQENDLGGNCHLPLGDYSYARQSEPPVQSHSQDATTSGTAQQPEFPFRSSPSHRNSFLSLMMNEEYVKFIFLICLQSLNSFVKNCNRPMKNNGLNHASVGVEEFPLYSDIPK